MGSIAPNSIPSESFFNANRVQGGLTPAMAEGYWNRDLDVAIIAGCSVLDIGVYYECLEGKSLAWNTPAGFAYTAAINALTAVGTRSVSVFNLAICKRE